MQSNLFLKKIVFNHAFSYAVVDLNKKVILFLPYY